MSELSVIEKQMANINYLVMINIYYKPRSWEYSEIKYKQVEKGLKSMNYFE